MLNLFSDLDPNASITKRNRFKVSLVNMSIKETTPAFLCDLVNLSRYQLYLDSIGVLMVDNFLNDVIPYNITSLDEF